MEINIGINEQNRQAVSMLLARLLADEYVLYTKTRRAHWHVEGVDFYEKHKFFEAQIDQLDEIIDGIAERIRSIGHFPPATLREFLAITSLIEHTREANDSQGCIRELLADHESVIMYIRSNINRMANEYQDIGTSDFITGMMEEHEKMAWFLRAHLK